MSFALYRHLAEPHPMPNPTIPIGPYMTATPLQITDRGEWEVRDRRNMVLGIIDYYPRWRQHVFTPERGVVLSWDCMTALAGFIKERVL